LKLGKYIKIRSLNSIYFDLSLFPLKIFIILSWGKSFFVFFNSKLYIQYLRQKWNLNLKKGVLKLGNVYFQKIILFFYFFCEFDNFYIYKKLRVEKDEKFSFLSRAQKKFTKIFDYLSWKFEAFPTNNFFFNVPMIFCSCVIRELSKGTFWLFILQ